MATLYYLLHQGDNLRLFLDHFGINWPINWAETAIYPEYAFLRDHWMSLARQEGKSKTQPTALGRSFLISAFTRLSMSSSVIEWAQSLSISHFNLHFAGRGSPGGYIYPGDWRVECYGPSIRDAGGQDSDIRSVYLLKASFHARPDLVIHLSPEHAIAVEAKLESPEARHPRDKFDRQVLREHCPIIQDGFLQTKLYEWLLDAVMGYSHSRAFIVRAKGEGANTRTWNSVMSTLDKATFSLLKPYQLQQVTSFLPKEGS
ncbi:hypothetical protein F1643_21610 [Azospirillum sp. INR13]|uniref:hypothetical protein n=1 Tax=Azospirillum sp. INR13 TaxID=2596919 RepID=UPI0018924DC8|nr:hypothetical protein [Azospirillum sp. INR13]MBF5096589.1 hypothetical protein [Azospirillum sp. INR13]